MTTKRFADYIGDTAPTLVEFCRPGKAEDEGVMSHLESALKDVANILTVDGTENPELMQAYKVGSYPTFILFKDGQEVWRDSGCKGFDELRHMIEKFI